MDEFKEQGDDQVNSQRRGNGESFLAENEEQLIQGVRDELQALTAETVRTKEHYLGAGERLVELRALGHKGRSKLEALCQQIGYDLTYEEAIQYIAIAENKELKKYWSRIICRGYSPLYAFTILTKYPDAYKKFRKEQFKGKGPYKIFRSKIVEYIPPRTQPEQTRNGANEDSGSGEAGVGCNLKLLDSEKETDFVSSVVALADRLNCEITPTSKFTEVRNKLDAKASDLE